MLRFRYAAPFQTSVQGLYRRSLQGGEIAVDRVLEAIDNCGALRTSLGNSVTVTLQDALRTPGK